MQLLIKDIQKNIFLMKNMHRKTSLVFGKVALQSQKYGEKTDKATYIQEVIKSDFAEPGDEDVFKKIQNDFKKINKNIPDEEIREQMKLTLERAKKDFI